MLSTRLGVLGSRSWKLRVRPESWRCFCDVADITRQLEASLTLHPPGAGADNQKIEKFHLHVQQSLQNGHLLRFEARGPQAVQNTIRALATSSGVRSEFEVAWSKDRALVFTARALDARPAELRTDSLHAVSTDSVLLLARKLKLRAKRGEVRIQAPVDDADAVNVLAKALATATAMMTATGSLHFLCIPSVRRDGLSVHVRSNESFALPELTGVTFTALPPGPSADPAYVERFRAATRDRILKGDTVEMECRGADAVEHAARALCMIPKHVANVQVYWVKRESLSAVGFRAVRGVTQKEFNSTEFTTPRLLVTPKTDLKKLAWAVVKAVRLHRAAAVHAYADNKDAMNVSIKALATVESLTAGSDRYLFIPSLGRRDNGSPVLRLYVKRAQELRKKSNV